MAQEIKNTFLKSKMNKDLDDRILPNGEYRDARNISVGRSEDNDVGALENVIGNNLVASTDIGDGLTIIGIHKDNSTDQIFVFLTDYTDPGSTNPTSAPNTSLHYIYVYNNVTESYTKLVEGEFLNFSTTNRIIGINLIENLLFWTDNRNQPRKINVILAVNSYTGKLENTVDRYYTQEHQISVAKYNPYQPIELYNRIDVEITTGNTGYFEVTGDQVDTYTPFIGATVVSAENDISGESFINVSGVSLNIANGNTRISVLPPFSVAPIIETYITLIQSTMTNQNSNLDWPGDPDYLEDKFVRFSYRFKYDDNEYSIMAPFTQIAYIPKQKGYFVYGDENSAYQSTVVDFMENSVQNIGLVIPLPTSGSRLLGDYKISELEILFRESGTTAVKVLESVTVQEVAAAVALGNRYTYDYQSRKPYKTLPEAQTIRVYDKVPIRAFSQESSGNRIIYGNYRDQHTPPANLNYNCVVSDKLNSGTSNNWIEYPNHSVKRNRNYQVGFVLADKFGRQSPVILSSVDAGITVGADFYSGSTIYSPYDATNEDTTVTDWFGDSIKVIVNAQITSSINSSTGTPGLYAIQQQSGLIGTGLGFAVGTVQSITNTEYTFRLSTTYPNNDNVPRIGDYMRGAYSDFVKVTDVIGPSGPLQYTVTTNGRVSDVYLRADGIVAGGGVPDIKFAYIINDLGWYSYKIVVKQTEQEYYNVYLPGILNGYPGQSGFASIDASPPNDPIPGERGAGNGLFPINETNLTAFTALFNDNINKIPRDLQELGPDQKQYSSSVTLYGRVTNIMTVDASVPVNLNPSTTTSVPFNTQYYPRLSSAGKNAIPHTSTAIANANEVNMGFSDLSNSFSVEPSTPTMVSNTGGYNGNLVFYQIETNPLIARISTTEKSIGATAGSVNSSGSYSDTNTPIYTANMLPYLAVYETQPVESLLDIYWETTSAGLIVDLNTAVASGSGGAASFKDVDWEFKEDFLPSGNSPTYVTGDFYPINEEGDPYLIATTGLLISQIDGSGADVSLFSLQPGLTSGTFRLQFDGPSQVFVQGSEELNVYSFVIRITTSEGNITEIPLGGVPGGEGAMQNIVPTFNFVTTIQKTPEDQVLIPAVPTIATAPWLATLPENGSSVTGNGKRSQLVYRISGRDTTPTLPDNWYMVPSTGELTQAVPGEIVDGVTFAGNTAQIYEAKLKVIDANAVGPVNDYGAKIAYWDFIISLGYPKVNVGVVSNTCLLNPYSSGVPGNSISVITPGNEVSHIYYLGGNSFETNLETIWDANGLSSFDQYSDSTRMNDGSTSNAHTKGTVAFTFNAQQGNDVGNTTSKFSVDKVVFYYRFEGGDGVWLPLDRSLDYNSTDKKATSGDFPGEDGLILTTGDNENTIKYLQNVRAYDYAAFAANSYGAGVEYAIIVKKLKFVSGVSGVNGNSVYGWVTADDLHHPACINRQGLNIAPAANYGTITPAANVGTHVNTFYKYFRSPGTTEYGPATVGVDEIFAETPYGEYVNVFFTSTAMSTPYVPVSGAQIFNFELDQTGYEVDYQWDNITGSMSNVILRWVALFDFETGVKLASSYGTSKATTTYTATGPGEGLRIYNGTTRVKVNQ